MEDMDTYSGEKRRKAEYTMAIQSVSASVQNLLLASYAEELGTCWFCAPLFCKETVRKVLKVPKNVEPQALIAIGYPAEKPEAPPRKPLSTVVFKNCWGCRV
jgi:nitroreductase